MSWIKEVAGGLSLRRRAGSGPRILFLHGLFCDGRYFHHAAEEAGLDGLELVAVDLPGFGCSPGVAGAAIAEMAEALRPLLEDTSGRPVLLASHSMATSPAARVAHLARGFVSIEGNILPGHLALSDRLVALDDKAFAAEFARIQNMADNALKWATTMADAGLRRQLSASYSRCTADAVQRVAREINADVRSGVLPSFLVAASLPMLTIYGTRSGYGGSRRELERIFPSMAFEAIEGARHFPMLDQPQRTYAAIAAFAREVVRTC